MRAAQLAALSGFLAGIGTASTVPPNMVGNLYYAGTKSFGSLLIATLGFKCADIRILLGSRAHADQMEGDALVKELTGATVMAMAEDVPALNNMK